MFDSFGGIDGFFQRFAGAAAGLGGWGSGFSNMTNTKTMPTPGPKMEKVIERTFVMSDGSVRKEYIRVPQDQASGTTGAQAKPAAGNVFNKYTTNQPEAPSQPQHPYAGSASESPTKRKGLKTTTTTTTYVDPETGKTVKRTVTKTVPVEVDDEEENHQPTTTQKGAPAAPNKTENHMSGTSSNPFNFESSPANKEKPTQKIPTTTNPAGDAPTIKKTTSTPGPSTEANKFNLNIHPTKVGEHNTAHTTAANSSRESKANTNTHPTTIPAPHTTTHTTTNSTTHPSTHTATHPTTHTNTNSNQTAHTATHPTTNTTTSSNPTAHTTTNPATKPTMHPTTHTTTHPSNPPTIQPTAPSTNLPAGHDTKKPPVKTSSYLASKASQQTSNHTTAFAPSGIRPNSPPKTTNAFYSPADSPTKKHDAGIKSKISPPKMRPVSPKGHPTTPTGVGARKMTAPEKPANNIRIPSPNSTGKSKPFYNPGGNVTPTHATVHVFTSEDSRPTTIGGFGSHAGVQSGQTRPNPTSSPRKDAPHYAFGTQASAQHGTSPKKSPMSPKRAIPTPKSPKQGSSPLLSSKPKLVTTK